MDLMEMFRQIGWFALLTLMMGVVPLVMAAAYAAWPTERRLALMRPLSLASLFAGLAGTLKGFTAVLMGVANSPELTSTSRQSIAAGLSESLVPTVFGLACLTVAWLLVAAGMSRSAAED
jgi:hypothetical protein